MEAIEMELHTAILALIDKGIYPSVVTVDKETYKRYELELKDKNEDGANGICYCFGKFGIYVFEDKRENAATEAFGYSSITKHAALKHLFPAIKQFPNNTLIYNRVLELIETF